MGILQRLRSLAVLALIGVSVSACGYNVIPTKQEAAKAAWAEVQNQYQRRADLVPNLVATVQGYAKQEKDVLTAGHRGARQGDLDSRRRQRPDRPGESQAVAGRAKRIVRRPRPTARDQRKLSGPQVEPEFLGATVPARGHREPYRRRPQGLCRRGAGLQHFAQDVPNRACGRRRCSAPSSHWLRSPPKPRPRRRRK